MDTRYCSLTTLGVSPKSSRMASTVVQRLSSNTSIRLQEDQALKYSGAFCRFLDITKYPCFLKKKRM